MDISDNLVLVPECRRSSWENSPSSPPPQRNRPTTEILKSWPIDLLEPTFTHIKPTTTVTASRPPWHKHILRIAFVAFWQIVLVRGFTHGENVPPLPLLSAVPGFLDPGDCRLSESCQAFVYELGTPGLSIRWDLLIQECNTGDP